MTRRLVSVDTHVSIANKVSIVGNFPDGLVVNTSPSNATGVGLIPGQGTKIPHASQLKYQNVKEKQCCNTFNKT